MRKCFKTSFSYGSTSTKTLLMPLRAKYFGGFLEGTNGIFTITFISYLNSIARESFQTASKQILFFLSPEN